MVGGSRRVHTKSRNGCTQCKRRKVKCNEQAPRCANCIKWDEECDFSRSENANNLPTAAHFRNAQRQISTRLNLPSPSSLPKAPAINLEHMELMYHYLTITSPTLRRSGAAGKRWEDCVPTEALQYSFLMHAVLGVSALHMAHLRSTSTTQPQLSAPAPNNDLLARDLARARVHQHAALSLFRSTVIDITPSNCTAAFLFSSLLLTFSCATTQTAESADQDHISGITTVLMSFRSHWKLFKSAREWIEQGPLGEFHLNTGETQDVARPQMVLIQSDAALLDLITSLSGHENDEAETAVYREAIAHMRTSLQAGASLARLLWPVFISDGFIDRLNRRRPMALVILAYGCALAKYGLDRWFVQDWTTKVVTAVAHEVRNDKTCAENMRWPCNELDITLYE